MFLSLSLSLSWQVFAPDPPHLPGGAAAAARAADAAARAADASAHTDPGDFLRTTSVDTILIAARRLHTQKLQGEGEGEGEGTQDERMWAFSDDEDDYA